jgi:hypothetical protein
MNNSIHRFSELFAQLGLPNDAPMIAQFIASQPPLPSHVALADAPCWTPAQAAFLREEALEDADWAELVDQLNLALR